MTLFVYKFISQAKLFCIYSTNEDFGLQKPFLLTTICITLQYKSFGTRKKYTKYWLQVQGLTFAKQVA